MQPAAAVDLMLARVDKAFERKDEDRSFRGCYVNDYYGDKFSAARVWEPRPQMGWVNDYYGDARAHEREEKRDNAGLVSDYYDISQDEDDEAAEPAAPPPHRLPRYTRCLSFADAQVPEKPKDTPRSRATRRRAPSEYGMLGGTLLYAPRNSRIIKSPA